jgi:hypothetical protein
VIAAPRQRLKTGAEKRKQQQHNRRAEFFALPFPVPAPIRRFAHSPIRRFAVSPFRLLPSPLAVSLDNFSQTADQ